MSYKLAYTLDVLRNAICSGEGFLACGSKVLSIFICVSFFAPEGKKRYTSGKRDVAVQNYYGRIDTDFHS
jgi:hypothetical protein